MLFHCRRWCQPSTLARYTPAPTKRLQQLWDVTGGARCLHPPTCPSLSPLIDSGMPQTKPSHNIVVREEFIGIIIVGGQVREVDLVAEEATDPTEAFDEL